MCSGLDHLWLGCWFEGKPHVHPELWSEVTASLERAKKNALRKGIQFHYYGPGIGEPRPSCTENVLNACFVSCRGDVSPCVMTNIVVREVQPVTYYFKGEDYPMERFLFGNVNDQSLPEIWKSEKARLFRAAFEQRLEEKNPGTSYLPPPCSHCYKLLGTSLNG